MENTKYTDLIGRFLSGEITADEKAVLMAWADADSANRAFFDEMARLWSVSGEYEEEVFTTDIETAWVSFEKKFEQRFPSGGGEALPGEEKPEGKVIRMRPMRLVLRYAAVLAALLAAGYWIFFSEGNSSQMVSFRAGPGERQELTLPDGSTVVLNENSELSYAEAFEERRARLTGEAFFQVTKRNGQTFTIDAEGATTTVLGTSFNVRAYPSEKEVEVSVKTGKVALQKAEDQNRRIILQAGQAGIYDKRKEAVEEKLISNADSWKTSRLDFNSIPLEAVVEALERYFHTNIEVANPKLLNCSFNGEFVQPELKEVLDDLAFTMMLEVEKKEDTYVLNGDASLCE
ncbi:MAG: FecR domain-containing protein [Lewinellaceae bacterium]|nr:FecR domain-containing protein [Lewinellaceae bacterium]